MKPAIGLLGLAGIACAVFQPPPRSPGTGATRASFGTTWDAAIGHLAAQGIRIRTMDRASGAIIAGQALPSYTVFQGGVPLAHCGTNYDGPVIPPSDAEYTIVIRGDSTRSTVEVLGRFSLLTEASRSTRPDSAACTSSGYGERLLMEGVAARAERRAERTVEQPRRMTGSVAFKYRDGPTWIIHEIKPAPDSASRLRFLSSLEDRELVGYPATWRSLTDDQLQELLMRATVCGGMRADGNGRQRRVLCPRL